MLPQSVINRQDQFLRLYEARSDALWRFVRSMVRTQHEAEDLVSDTIRQKYQALHRLSDEPAFVAFMFTIAHRVACRATINRSVEHHLACTQKHLPLVAPLAVEGSFLFGHCFHNASL